MEKEVILKTKFSFDAAHRLVGHSGLCSNLHGHIWDVYIQIIGTNKDLDCNGIIWDFANTKLLKELFDHKTILKSCPENIELIKAIQNTCGVNTIYTMKNNPTAENLCFEILDHLETSNPDLKYEVEVYESPKSSCKI